MTNQAKYYKIEGDKLVRTHRTCPKCGPAVFLADHYDRWTCGACKYTIFKRKGKKTTGTGPGPAGPRRRSSRKRVKSQ